MHSASSWIGDAVFNCLIGFLAAGAAYLLGAVIQIMLFANCSIIFPFVDPLLGGPDPLVYDAVQLFSEAGTPFLMGSLAMGVVGSAAGVGGILCWGRDSQANG